MRAVNAFALCWLIVAGQAFGAGLTPWPSLDPPVRNTLEATLQVYKGQGTDSLYPLEVDQTTGALPVEGISGGVPIPISGTVRALQSGTWSVGITGLSTVSGIFQDGVLAYSALTTSYQTILTPGNALYHIDMRNNTNGTVLVSFDQGGSLSYTLDAGDAVSLDLYENYTTTIAGDAIQVKYSGTAPTSGNMHVNGYY